MAVWRSSLLLLLGATGLASDLTPQHLQSQQAWAAKMIEGLKVELAKEQRMLNNVTERLRKLELLRQRANETSHTPEDTATAKSVPLLCVGNIKSTDGACCCPKTCGHCGGNHCDRFPGGPTQCCCTSGIVARRGAMCEWPEDTACILSADAMILPPPPKPPEPLVHPASLCAALQGGHELTHEDRAVFANAAAKQHVCTEAKHQDRVRLIFLTITYARKGRVNSLCRLAAFFRHEAGNSLWVLSEDGEATDPAVIRFLKASDFPAFYISYGPSHFKGHDQRAAGLRFIQDHELVGIVYQPDDDNRYCTKSCIPFGHPQPPLSDRTLWSELRKTDRVSVLAVGGLGGPEGAERPHYDASGKLTGWNAQMGNRLFPIDVAGFAFNASLLKNLSRPLWNLDCHVGHEPGERRASHAHAVTKCSVRAYCQLGSLNTKIKVCIGESLFLQHLGLTRREELKPLGNFCNEIYVHHNRQMDWPKGLPKPTCSYAD